MSQQALRLTMQTSGVPMCTNHLPAQFPRQESRCSPNSSCHTATLNQLPDLVGFFSCDDLPSIQPLIKFCPSPLPNLYLGGFLLLRFESPLYVLGLFLVSCVICKYLLPVFSLSFYSLQIGFRREKVLHFDEIYQFSLTMLWVSCLRILYNPGS